MSLPVDPDLSPRGSGPVPTHRQYGVLVVVGVGGAIGSCARYGVGLAVPAAASGFPRATLTVNLIGCLLLGALVETLAVLVRRGSPAERYARPFAGAGILGGFTTYSTFAVETDRLISAGHGLVAGTYVLSSIGLGLLAATLGIAGARRALAGRSSIDPASAV